MPVQSRRLSKAGIEVLKNVMKRNGWTQTELVKEVDISRSTLNQLLKEQPVKLDTIENLCDLLELEIGQILEPIASSDDLEALVKRLRSQGSASIQKRCGEMRVLDMTTPIGLGSIYTDVNILERLASKTRRKMGELMDCGPEEFDRFGLGKVREERVDGLEAVERVRQLMILGRPGAGKTTFMKRLATVCNGGEFLAGQVPIFVTLKEWAETVGKPGLLEFLGQSFSEPIEAVKQSLESGRGLVLLDGLDEVLEADHDRVLTEIRNFAENYSDNNIVITCRIAAREYVFQQFTEVEVADFSDEQIQEFANRWFLVREPESVDDEGRSTVGQLFWDALSDRKPVKELAANPLLLTLLCLEFENSAEFPKSRAELYERGLNVLLSKWDGQRRIRRESAYGKLSVKRKESLLAQLAIATFERGEYFFKERVATQEIGKYIENLPGARSDEDLMVDSRSVLRDIVAQHGLLTERATGIYSFSHLTFHEYFVARSIVDISNPVKYEAALSLLIEHMADKRWREVFLLVVERSDDAGYVLSWMKRQIDRMLAGDEKLQRFLVWLNEKAASSKVDKMGDARAYYCLIAIVIAGSYLTNPSHYIPIESLLFPLDNALIRILGLSAKNTPVHFVIDDFDRALEHSLNNDELTHYLQEFRNQLLVFNDNQDQSERWYKFDGERWRKNFRKLMIEDRNIGHDWQFSESQKKLMSKYYDANKLLVDCLNSECYANRQVLQQIENTLLLPLAEIPLAPL
ncbi:MAG: NACHT domain-containing protein [Cyanobacteria bacterium]|nr:NACHT domain-containing protein [Cyanobacteriota bacterium]